MNSKVAQFLEKVTDSKRFEPLMLTIGAIIGIILCFICIDYTPATTEDYKPLLEIQDALIQDFDNVYTYPDADINITDTNIKIFVENDDCSINIIFDKNKKYLYTESSDNSASIPLFLFAVLVCSALISFAFLLLSLVIIFMLQSLFELIYLLINKKKETWPYDNITTKEDMKLK